MEEEIAKRSLIKSEIWHILADLTEKTTTNEDVLKLTKKAHNQFLQFKKLNTKIRTSNGKRFSDFDKKTQIEIDVQEAYDSIQKIKYEAKMNMAKMLLDVPKMSNDSKNELKNFALAIDKCICALEDFGEPVTKCDSLLVVILERKLFGRYRRLWDKKDKSLFNFKKFMNEMMQEKEEKEEKLCWLDSSKRTKFLDPIEEKSLNVKEPAPSGSVMQNPFHIISKGK